MPRTAGGAAGVSLVAGIGCALVGVGLGDYDLVEMLVIAAVWAAIILTAVLAARRRGLPVLRALLGALLIPFVITHRYDSAPVYLRLLPQAPDAFAAWSVFAIPLAAATALRPHGASDTSIRPTPSRSGPIVWLALYTASSWIAGQPMPSPRVSVGQQASSNGGGWGSNQLWDPRVRPFPRGVAVGFRLGDGRSWMEEARRRVSAGRFPSPGVPSMRCAVSRCRGG